MAVLLLGGLAACTTVEDAPRGEQAYAIMPPPPAVGLDYRIAPDDVLRIQVYHEPDLSLEDARVDAQGMVRMPLIGAVPVAGLSASEAADVVAGRLGERYLVSPQVSLFVKTAVGRRITLDGPQQLLVPLEKAEMLAANCPVPLERVGVNDTFGESGEGDELLEKYGLSSEHIIAAARRAAARKT